MAFTMRLAAACAFIACGAIDPALADASSQRELLCKTNEQSGTAREFVIRFGEAKGKLKPVSVTEKQRIFTPGNAVALWSTANGGTMITIPDQRPGKWSGVATTSGYDFTLKAADGSAVVSLLPTAANSRQYEFKWSANARTPFGEDLNAEGTGTCQEQEPSQ